ncbi:MAG: hypothetical protein B7Z06_01990 [Flavobacteriales bacterium 32-35-8]|nr:MAG: hypothetical protein B7Z06_01990 [Flavobacteriales bacterium 32-35-8]
MMSNLEKFFIKKPSVLGKAVNYIFIKYAPYRCEMITMMMTETIFKICLFIFVLQIFRFKNK